MRYYLVLSGRYLVAFCLNSVFLIISAGMVVAQEVESTTAATVQAIQEERQASSEVEDPNSGAKGDLPGVIFEKETVLRAELDKILPPSSAFRGQFRPLALRIEPSASTFARSLLIQKSAAQLQLADIVGGQFNSDAARTEALLNWADSTEAIRIGASDEPDAASRSSASDKTIEIPIRQDIPDEVKDEIVARNLETQELKYIQGNTGLTAEARMKALLEWADKVQSNTDATDKQP